MAKAATIKEFNSSDGQSSVPDPVDTGNSKRPADKDNGDKTIPVFATKVDAVGAVMDALAGLTKDQIGDVFKGMTDKLDLSAEKSKATRRLGTATDAAESVAEIFGDTLTEENLAKAATLFEAAVNSKINLETIRLEEEFEGKLVESLEEKVKALSENVDKYLTYAVEVWAEENKIAIENGLRAEVTEGFLRGLKNLFTESYVDIPEDKVDLVAELSAKVADIEEKYNEAVAQNFVLKDTIDEAKVAKIFSESIADLPATKQDKMRTLVEGLEYEDAEDFTKKIEVIKESYFGNNTGSSTTKKNLMEELDIDEDDDATVKHVVTGQMADYVKALSNV